MDQPQASMVAIGEPQDLPSPQKPSKILLFLLISLLIFLSLVAGSPRFRQLIGEAGWWARGYFAKSTITSTASPSETPTTLPTADPMAHWKTYVIANYAFQYPPTFNFQESSASFVHARFESTPYPNLIFRIVLDGAGTGFQCTKQISSLEESVNGHPVQKITLRGTASTEKPPCDQQDLSDRYTIITTLNPSEKLHDDFIFSFSTKELSLDQAQTTLDDILSTFKFLDVTPTCRPRPACLDATPRCLIPETPDMCPKSTPTSNAAR